MTTLTEQELATVAAYEEHADEWDAAHNDPVFWRDAMGAFEQALPEGDVVEIGSGGGYAAHWLTMAGYGYLGTDVSPALIRIARRRVPEARFLNISPYELPEVALAFDGFWATASLVHVPRERTLEALKAIRQVLREGATGFIGMKAGDGSHTEDHAKPAPGRNFTFWTCAGFAGELERAGFTITEFWQKPAPAGPVATGTWLSFLVKATGRPGQGLDRLPGS